MAIQCVAILVLLNTVTYTSAERRTRAGNLFPLDIHSIMKLSIQIRSLVKCR